MVLTTCSLSEVPAFLNAFPMLSNVVSEEYHAGRTATISRWRLSMVRINTANGTDGCSQAIPLLFVILLAAMTTKSKYNCICCTILVSSYTTVCAVYLCVNTLPTLTSVHFVVKSFKLISIHLCLWVYINQRDAHIYMRMGSSSCGCTVIREIFIGKIFLWGKSTTKIKRTKIFI